MNPVTTAESAETAAERDARADGVMSPHDRECLSCYLERMLGAYGCVGDRFLRHWAAGHPGGVARVRAWARSEGGYCDCEVVLNALSRRDVNDPTLICARALAVSLDGEDD